MRGSLVRRRVPCFHWQGSEEVNFLGNICSWCEMIVCADPWQNSSCACQWKKKRKKVKQEMIKNAKVEVLLRNSLDCYESAYPCTMPLKFPAGFSQNIPVQYPCETKVFKNSPYEDIYSSKVTSAFLTSALRRWVCWGLCLERFGLLPACRIMLFSVPCMVPVKPDYVFSGGTLLSSESRGEFLWRLLLAKVHQCWWF